MGSVPFLKTALNVFSMHKTFNAVFKNGFSPVLGAIPRLPIHRYFVFFNLDFSYLNI